jgi:circadian clock protein KaiC
MRGCEHSSHKHPMRITSKGMTVFPRLRMDSSDIILGDEKISIGVKSINKMMGGGVYKGDATLVIGGTGTGKTLLGLHFIKEGIDKGERGLIISLDEFPSALRRNANSFGFDLVPLEEKGLLKIISPSTPDFIPEELISQAEEEWDKVERVFVDSLSRYISSFPDLLEFRDHLLALLSMFKRKGITSLFTLQTGNEIEFQSSGPFFLMDNIISLKYLESGTSVSRAISILKTRGSSHTEETMKLMITRRKMDVKKFERVID